jgi:hypothetical protein
MLRAYIREQLAATWPMTTASYLPLLARIAGASGLIAANAGLVTGQIREQLESVINRGAVALIVDMRATASCDHAGADAIMRAYQRAVASGTDYSVGPRPEWESMVRLVPGLQAVRSYRRRWLARDIVAGVVLTTLLVPQGMALRSWRDCRRSPACTRPSCACSAMRRSARRGSWCWARIPRSDR